MNRTITTLAVTAATCLFILARLNGPPERVDSYSSSQRTPAIATIPLIASSPPPPPLKSITLDPPPGINITRATRAALTRGCTGGRTSGDGVSCTSTNLEALLARPVETRFDRNRRNPCTPDGHCVPYFYLLGTL